MNIYDREIVNGYEAIKKMAIKACRKGDIRESINRVEQVCCISNELNWKYKDDDIDRLIDDLSKLMISSVNDRYLPRKKRIVFYDQYGKSFILALQYIYALTAAGYDILYILSDYVKANLETFIIEDLKKMENIAVEIIPSEWDYPQRVKRIFHLTMSYGPEKIFLHVKMLSAFNLVLPALPHDIIKYYIDLQDHACWIKNTNIDYVIPYRDWGATIELEKRGFKKSQILKVPYYPIIIDREFQGFPMEAEGKVIVFTGGSYYKTVDKDNSYWDLVVRLLLENPNSVVLYAGKEDNDAKDKSIRKLANGQNLSNRLIPIGFRTDVNEVFEHCDIYMGTTPMSGGLMCQYAAYNSKPILQYYPPNMSANNETEQVIDFNGKVDISFTDKEAFLIEAKRLIDDESYRKKRGKEIHDCLIRKEQFDDLVARTVESNSNQVKISWQAINYESFSKWWLYLEKVGIFSCRSYVLSLLKRKKFFKMPLSALKQLFKK